MRVSAKKSPSAPTVGTPPKVLLEFLLSKEEALAYNPANPAVGKAVGECISEHLKTGFRVARQVEARRG